MQKTNFGLSHGRVCSVIDLVSRRSLNDMSGAEAESYVLKTAIFLIFLPRTGPPDPLLATDGFLDFSINQV